VLSRRTWLQAVAATSCCLLIPSVRGASLSNSTRLLAAWQTTDDQFAGIIRAQAGRWEVEASVALPGRAHGLQALSDGSVLVVARRPGDWLLHWQPGSGVHRWHWPNDDRRCNGHLLTVSPQAESFFTTETDQGSGHGLIGVRDRQTMEKLAEWPTHGLDPHQMLILPQALMGLPAGALLVANGGIPTLAESGRSKKLVAGMDSSLVALDSNNGQLLGQWRLADARLSLRHLAWDSVSGEVGIALQAEHDDPAIRHAAPVLARWNGKTLQLARQAARLQGYGGSICAAPRGGFVVSCPRADGTAWFDVAGLFLTLKRQAEVCPLALDKGLVWAGGANRVSTQVMQQTTWSDTNSPAARSWQFDNHWHVLTGQSARADRAVRRELFPSPAGV
jgi:hypothetical protein